MSRAHLLNNHQTETPGVFGPPRPLRRGSITLRWVRCGKPGCPCATDDDARHGPYPSLSMVVNGRKRTVHLHEEDSEIVSRQIEQYRKIRDSFDAWVEECEKVADQELESFRQETAEKMGSKRRSRRVLRKKSKN